NGLHTNGYSLARKVLLNKFNLDENISEINSSLKTELLKVHKSYLELIQSLTAKIEINAFSHITGGGIVGNTKRVVPEGLKIEIDWSTWEVPPIFKLIKNVGNISDNEMRKVFNMGIGLIAVIDEVNLDQVRNISASLNEEPIILGNIV
ncbi:MAG: phosphoribosylformylglycinamidine cyclo-ligase, partial [Ignavibacteriae bacterium]|nr:phosphoribosylformylglycinamidine cyclo-ligase [Ignavibacteriota bacterium]